MNLDEDSKLEYKKEARENYEKYANLSHNISRKSRKLDRDFCKWLVDHFDHNSCALDICGRRLPISTKDVEFILGIKSSGVDVSTVAGAEEINHICQQHGLNVVGDIPINLLEEMDGGHETENIPLEKQDINESHAMSSQHEDKPNMDSDEAIRRIEQLITSLRDEMLVMQKTVIEQSITSVRDEMLVM
ncbi:hypothetical protein SO802_023682 [Lithocarpus litseifolius]|uniref:Uncharacterized protein n=1 Tax=Lithocarpus litseifolius TaxID=425828 RepID=A0AAW2CAS3_9ROSI